METDTDDGTFRGYCELRWANILSFLCHFSVPLALVTANKPFSSFSSHPFKSSLSPNEQALFKLCGCGYCVVLPPSAFFWNCQRVRQWQRVHRVHTAKFAGQWDDDSKLLGTPSTGTHVSPEGDGMKRVKNKVHSSFFDKLLCSLALTLQHSVCDRA